MIKRTPIRKRRSKPRRGQPTKDEKRILRSYVAVRALLYCEIKGPGCQGYAPTGDDEFYSGQLVHLRAKRRFGWEIDNLCWGCRHCHMDLVHMGKLKLPATYAELPAWRATLKGAEE
jgi:hypothetical protein